jgi:hypothetical protein
LTSGVAGTGVSDALGRVVALIREARIEEKAAASAMPARLSP